MTIQTAIKQLNKDAEFLGMGLLELLQFIKENPMAQTQATMNAYRVFMGDAKKFFA
jgi:hypothetical protein